MTVRRVELWADCVPVYIGTGKREVLPANELIKPPPRAAVGL